MQTKLKNNSNFFERILQIIEFYNIKNVSEFAKKNLGYDSPEKINRLKKDGAKPSYDIIQDISNAFEELNSGWLVTGKGKMINEDYLPDIDKLPPELLHTTTIKAVPYYDIDITASIKESFTDVMEEPEFYVDFKPFNDCTAYLPVWGDSMFPTYASGEIVAVKKVDNPDIILWGEAYLIITNEIANNMKTVKLLYPHDDEDKIILRASNPNFKGDTVIPKESILNLYTIKGKITRKQL
jgi:phage repressor protein C with HTH and peptisase S24 domain